MNKYGPIIGKIENIDLNNFEFKDYISASQIKGFNCPTRWADSLLNPSINLSSGPTAFGDAIHVTIEKLSHLAIEKYDRYTGMIPDSVISDYWRDMISLYPSLVSGPWYDRGKRQLAFWIKEERNREARIYISPDEVPGIEINFYCYLKNGVMVRGIIDRIETNKYTKENELDLVDWKTGFLKDDHTGAMTLYKIAGNQVIAKDKIIKTKILELEREYFQYYTITKEDIENYNDHIILIRQTIENFVLNIQRFLDSKNWEGLYDFLFQHANVNKWCYTCRLSSVCKTYINKIYGFVPALSETEDLTREDEIKFLTEQEEHLKMIGKSIDKMKDNIDSKLIDILSRNEGESIEIDDISRLELISSSRTHIMESIALPIIIKRNLLNILKIGVKGFAESIVQLEKDSGNCKEDEKNDLNRDIELLKASEYKVKGNDSWKLIKNKPKKEKKKKKLDVGD